MDSLCLQNIPLWTRIGVPEEERTTEQRLTVTVEIFGDFRAVAKSDDVTKGLDYDAIFAIVENVGKTERKTIECLAEDLATAILKAHQIASVKVSVIKPLPGEKESCITITRP